MKRSSIFSLAALVLTLCACGPEIFTMNLETRQPSISGLDLGGKSISVVYLDEAGKDTVFNKSLATGFAQTLEKEYFNGEEAVGIYRMIKQPGANYASRDTLLNLVIDSNDDVVFLFDATDFQTPELGESRASALDAADSTRVTVAKVPYAIRLYAYDSMNKQDTVRTFIGNSTFNQVIFGGERTTQEELTRRLWDNTGNTEAQALTVGEKSAERFKPTWKEEAFSFYYYEDNNWTTAAEAAYNFQWNKAVDQWLQLLNTRNADKRARAEYNLAAACFLMGDIELAEGWLDKSDKDGPVELSGSLRRKIINKKN